MNIQFPEIIEEAHYEETMTNIVEPYLEKCSEILRPEREPGHYLFCVHYHTEEPKGIIFISHGFTESAEKYKEMAYYFLQAGYDVYIPEHCGHGRSYQLSEDLSPVYTDNWKRYVDDYLFLVRMVKDVRDDLPYYLFAHSMGGGIAASVASFDSTLFKKVLLSSPMIRPLTGNLPWPVARTVIQGACLIGHDKNYAPGQQAFDGNETFADSAAISEPRFSYYSKKRLQETYLQMSGASYGWLKAAASMSHYLLTSGYKRITCPVLLFQAEHDDFVDNKAQTAFISKIHHSGNHEVSLVKVPKTKHEIYLSTDDIMHTYLKRILYFYSL